MFERLGIALGGEHLAPIEVCTPNEQLLVTADTMVPDVHYFADIEAGSVGHKLAAVNLSDIAAMGGEPKAAILQLSGFDPSAPHDVVWLGEFAKGLFGLLDAFEVKLLGTTAHRGGTPLTLQLLGTVPTGTALRRDQAEPGDLIFVTGTLGDAALALGLELRDEQSGLESLVASRLHRPTPRVAVGQALRGIASAAIDISDGLASDLGHIVSRSQVGALIMASVLPRSVSFNTLIGPRDPLSLCLHGGDDYELLFTAPERARDEVQRIAQRLDCPITEIGRLSSDYEGVWIRQHNGTTVHLPAGGYQHFANDAEE
ncbi:MAG: thiamine-phosphate kinase [Gammaproteobacteria bacterium]|nr:thiamine-phosphate kinase [Gammaproteobacteria bacterium]